MTQNWYQFWGDVIWHRVSQHLNKQCIFFLHAGIMFPHTRCVLHQPTVDLVRCLWRSQAFCRTYRTLKAHMPFPTVNNVALCSHMKNNNSTLYRTRTRVNYHQLSTYSAIFHSSNLLRPRQSCQVRTYASKQKTFKSKSERRRKPVEKKQVVDITPEMTVNQLAVAMGGDKGKQAMLPMPWFWHPIGKLFKAFRGDQIQTIPEDNIWPIFLCFINKHAYQFLGSIWA